MAESSGLEEPPKSPLEGKTQQELETMVERIRAEKVVFDAYQKTEYTPPANSVGSRLKEIAERPPRGIERRQEKKPEPSPEDK